MSSVEEMRAEAAERRRQVMTERSQHPQLTERQAVLEGERRDDAVVPDRYAAFPAEVRSETVERDGKQFLRVEGYATVFGRGYEMWDVFGPYEETVARGAADATIGAQPDVVFLVNHRGLAMARTGGPWNGNSPTLELSADELGLRDVAWLNPERSDVRDLGFALDDKVVTEQSFAFRIDEGLWNEDFTEFTIVRFDINRGDVSAVNHGANPFTSIAARQQQIMAEARILRESGLPLGWAVESVLTRRDLTLDEMSDRFMARRDLAAAAEKTQRAEPDPQPRGRSLLQVAALLED